MMLKLNILNMINFLKTVNECSGPVVLVSQDGRREDMNKQESLQERLLKNYKDNRRSLKMWIDVAEPAEATGSFWKNQIRMQL